MVTALLGRNLLTAGFTVRPSNPERLRQAAVAGVVTTPAELRAV
jgi:hypothetical protein